jgi:preprotein translocase subunit SecG
MAHYCERFARPTKMDSDSTRLCGVTEILASSNFQHTQKLNMEKFQLFLLILQVIIAVTMIILVLIQKSDGDSLSGIGGGSGGLNSIISSKASANILSKTTMVLIAIFMINCLILASLSHHAKKATASELDKIIDKQEKSAPVEPMAPAAPQVP